MSDPVKAAYPPDHNMPPIVLPKDEEMLADLKRKYPEIEKEIPVFEKSFATYDGADGNPLELGLGDTVVAKALGDLIDDAKKTRRRWKSDATGEKGPLNKLVKIVGNFFSNADEKMEALLAKYEPVQEAFIQKVNDQKERDRQADIARQEKIAEDARLAAAAEAKRAADAQAEADRQRQAEAEARAAAEKAKAEKEEAEARAAAAKAEEKRLADAKVARDRAEKEKNATSIRDIKANMKTVERTNDLAEAEEATDAEIKNLDMLVRAGGIVGNLAAEIFYSPLLDDEQKAYLTETRERLGVLRKAFNDRINKREQAKREKERLAHDAAEKVAAETRRVAKEKADKELADAQQRTREENAKAEAAAEERRRQDAAARTARETARDHEKVAKDAGKGAAKATDEADRADNRADRIEGRGEARSNVKGDMGSVSTLARTWKNYIDDEEAIRATLGPLGAHLNIDAIKAATYFYMRAHQAAFKGERVMPAELPGVRFSLEEDLRS